MTADELRRLLWAFIEAFPEGERLVRAMVNPDPVAFFSSVEGLKKRMAKRRAISEAQFEHELAALEQEARLLPLEARPEAGLALVELGTLGYEFSHLLDLENTAAVNEGLLIFAEASLALGRVDEALAKLRELEETSNYGLNAQEAVGVLAKAR